MNRMNRKRFTKLVTLAVLLSVFAYFTIKDQSNNPRSGITTRQIDGMFIKGLYIHLPSIKLQNMTSLVIAREKRRGGLLKRKESVKYTKEPWQQKQNMDKEKSLQMRKALEEELQAMKKKEQMFVKNLIKARKNEEELKNNLIRLSRELRANNRVRDQQHNTPDDFKLPTVFVITPTFRRFVQKAELTRVSQALKPARNLHWIVVEDSVNKTNLVANFLRNSGLKYTHLNTRTPEILRRHKNEIRRSKPRGVVQRNLGIQWIRKNIDPLRTPGVVYFADDDNTYDSRIFDEMRWVQGVGVWPVAFTGGVRWAGPVCKDGHVISFHAQWGLFRPFPIDMAAFAVNIKKFIIDFPKAEFLAPERAGMLESSLLTQITTIKELEPVTPNCSKVYVWHTRTEVPRDSIVGERRLIKQGTSSDKNIET